MSIEWKPGMRGVTRDGSTTGPLERHQIGPSVSGFRASISNDAASPRLWTTDGAHFFGETCLDLISEYIEPPVLSGPGPLLAVLLERPAKVAADTPEIVLREGVACYGAKARIDHDGDLRIVGDSSGKCSVAGEALREFHSWLGQHLSRAGDPL